jgi:type II secretory pathway pseudopilin PulG
MDAPRTTDIPGLVRSDESGFTLIELVVASGVILTAIMLVTTVITTGVTQTAVARQQQSADGVANQTLEQIRALPFQSIQQGLSNTDTASDPKITSSGCPTAPCFGGEMLVTSTGLPNVDPLVPHQKALAVGPTTYNVSSYITYYQNDKTINTYRATVYVNWTGIPAGRASKVQVQSVIFTQQNCLSTTTHPISGPCNPSFSAAALSDTPSVSVTGTVAGVTLDHLQLWGGRATSDILVEQITRADGVAQAPGATLQAVGGNEVTVGRQTASSKADNDPGTSPLQTYDSQSLSAPAATQSVGAVAISATTGSSGTTTSTTSASTASNFCPQLTGYTNENDSQPCGGSAATQGATVTASTTLDVLGALPLASISPQVTPVVAITDVNKGPGTGTPGTGTCPSTPTTGDGCARSSMSRSGADIGIAALGTLAPALFSNYVKVMGLADLTKAEAGPGVNAPSAAVTAGTIQYWNGLNYTSVPIGTLVSPITIPTLSINTNILVPALGTQVTLTGSVQPPSKSTASTTVTNAADPTCANPPGTCITSATAKSSGPTINVTFKVVVLGVTVADLAYSVDTGTIQSKATYTATPAS